MRTCAAKIPLVCQSLSLAETAGPRFSEGLHLKEVRQKAMEQEDAVCSPLGSVQAYGCACISKNKGDVTINAKEFDEGMRQEKLPR